MIQLQVDDSYISFHCDEYGLRQLANAVGELKSIEIPVVPISSKERWRLETKDAWFKGCISADLNARSLNVSGTSKVTQLMAEVLCDWADGRVEGNSCHMHVEYYEQYPYLSEESCPVIVYIKT